MIMLKSAKFQIALRKTIFEVSKKGNSSTVYKRTVWCTSLPGNRQSFIRKKHLKELDIAGFPNKYNATGKIIQ